MNLEQQVADDLSGIVTIGESAQLEAVDPNNSLNLDLVKKAVDHRVTQWKSMIESELQSLITQAAQIRSEISNAKTATKRKYFNKKFAKVNVQVRQMIVALQRVQANDTTPSPGPRDASDTTAI